MRRALLKVLEVADGTIVEYVIRRTKASDVIMYIFVGITVGNVAIQLSNGSTPLLIFGIIMLGIAPVVILLAHMLEWFIKFVHLPRKFGNNQISAVLRWRVIDLLEERGITDTKKYFREHPNHIDALFEVIADLYSVDLDEWNEIAALVFISDENPAATGEAIVALVDERGDMPANEFKALLEIRGQTASPLMDGAL